MKPSIFCTSLHEFTQKFHTPTNDTPVYINVNSNHPPSIIKAIPGMIEKRLSTLSSNNEIFEASKPIYEHSLKESGFNVKLAYQQRNSQPKNSRNRGRNIIWFNPPFSLNVISNIAKDFLRLLDQNFPKHHRLHKIFNRNNVKVSYCTMPNFAAAINSHNKKILHQVPQNNQGCNCRTKSECPLEGNCRQKNVVYKCDVNSTTPNKPVTYIGCTGQEFKSRYRDHKSSFNVQNKRSATTLAAHIWKLKDNEVTPQFKWSIIDKAAPYIHGSRRCPLCITEKFHITYSNSNLINQRSEIAQKCRHQNKFILKNFKGWIKVQSEHDNG